MRKGERRARIALELGVGGQGEAAHALAQTRQPARHVGAQRQDRLAAGHGVHEDRQGAVPAAVHHHAGRAGSGRRSRARLERRIDLGEHRVQVAVGRAGARSIGGRGARLGVAQHQPRLDRAVPALRSSRNVASSGWPGSSATLPVAAERDRAGADAPGADREADVAPLPHRPHVVEAPARDEQRGAGLPMPNGASALELLGQPQAELVAGDDRVDALDGLEQVGREHRLGVGLERRAERVDALAASIVSPAAARWPP